MSNSTTNRPVIGSRWSYTKIGYALTQSIQQLRERSVATLITLFVLGTTLALPAVFWFGSASLSEIVNRSVGKESVTVYLSLDVSDTDGAALAQRWQNQDGVSTTRYISRAQALALFQQQTDLDDAIAALGDNPLPGAVVVFPEIDANAPAELTVQRVTAMAQAFTELATVERVQIDLDWVRKLQSVLTLFRIVVSLLAIFLTLTGLLVIGNTVRLELLRRQREFEVSTLLGASRSFLNRPILYTGTLYGLLGGAIAAVLATVAYSFIKTPADQLAAQYASSFRLDLPTAGQFLTIIAVATALGLLGALITVFRPSQTYFSNR